MRKNHISPMRQPIGGSASPVHDKHIVETRVMTSCRHGADMMKRQHASLQPPCPGSGRAALRSACRGSGTPVRQASSCTVVCGL
eukprot:364586-Chlamydomonas_euryale.AAC.4